MSRKIIPTRVKRYTLNRIFYFNMHTYRWSSLLFTIPFGLSTPSSIRKFPFGPSVHIFFSLSSGLLLSGFWFSCYVTRSPYTCPRPAHFSSLKRLCNYVSQNLFDYVIRYYFVFCHSIVFHCSENASEEFSFYKSAPCV